MTSNVPGPKERAYEHERVAAGNGQWRLHAQQVQAAGRHQSAGPSAAATAMS